MFRAHNTVQQDDLLYKEVILHCVCGLERDFVSVEENSRIRYCDLALQFFGFVRKIMSGIHSHIYGDLLQSLMILISGTYKLR